MTRILVDIPADDIEWLDRLAEERGKSRAAILRETVAAYKSHAVNCGRNDWIERGRGYWKGRAGLTEPVEGQRAARGGRGFAGEV